MRLVCRTVCATQMGVYKEHEMMMAAESMLVTYMANGTTPDELEAYGLQVYREWRP